MFGQNVMEKNSINGKVIDVNAEKLCSGVYVFEITEEGKKIYSGKAIVY
jgi:hypothetical protein